MARRRLRLPPESQGADRWLVSYADYVTLLFAFFVAMYALSASGSPQLDEVRQAIQTSFGKVGGVAGDPVSQIVEQLSPETKQQLAQRNQARRASEAMTRMESNLLDVMAPMVKDGKVRITRSRHGVSIEINANVLFAPGRADLHIRSLDPLRTIAGILRGETYDIEISGHTDNRPIENAEFASNWELSAVRASRVVRLLAEEGIAPPRLKAVGREASQPIAPNETDEGRSRNRRVELLILAAPADRIDSL